MIVRSKILALAVCALSTNIALAMPAQKYKQAFDGYKYHYPVEGEIQVPTQADIDDILKSIKSQESKRSVAAVGMTSEAFEGLMSPEFKGIRDELLKIDSGDMLDEKLSDLDRNFKGLKSNDSRFFVAQLIPLRAMRGIVWRLKPFVSDEKLMHSVLLTAVKNVVITSDIFSPTNQTKALTEYLTRPFVEDGQFPWTNKGQIVTPFHESKSGGEAELQAHFVKIVLPMLNQAVYRIASRDAALSKDTAFDNRIWYGTNTFPEAMNRYAIVGEIERQVAITNLCATISELSFQAAYSWNGTLELNHDISMHYGFDSTTFEVTGVPLEERVSVIRSNKYSNWGVLIHPELLKSAWKMLTAAVLTSDAAWQGMLLRPPGEVYMYNTSSAGPLQRVGNLRIGMLKNLTQNNCVVSQKNNKVDVTGCEPVQSSITGETAFVNLRAFYANPPKDLKSLYPLPGQFKQPTKSMKLINKDMLPLTLKTAKGDVTVEYRDYTLGRGLEWDVSADSPYRTLFPDVADGKADFLKHVRILSQGWASAGIASPIANYIE